MMSVAAQSGEKIKVGGFVGVTVGGTYATVYENCLYDNTLAPIDRIGNADMGRGDGIAAKSSEDLKELSYENGFVETVWILGGGSLPILAWEG